jgi:hypothetical protein
MRLTRASGCNAWNLAWNLAQISMTSGVLSFAILGGIAQALERFLPLDAGLININNPSEALVLALAGTLAPAYAPAQATWSESRDP